MGSGAQGAVTLVNPDEELCRLCFSAAIPISRDRLHPNQIDPETLLIRLEELGWEDFGKRGFSVMERSKYSLQRAEAVAQDRDAARKAKGQDARYQLVGALITNAAAINAITNDAGVQVFKVLSTSTAQEPAHAEIRVDSQFNQSQFMKFRMVLRDTLGKLRHKECINPGTPLRDAD